MSGDPAADDDGITITAFFDSCLINAYIILSASVLIFFEYLITVDREIGLFWKRQLSIPSAIFLTNRYLILLYSALILVPNFDMSLTENEMAAFAEGAAKYNGRVLLWTFSALRALALTGSRSFSVIILLLYMGPVGVNVAYLTFGLDGFVDPLFGCLEDVFAPPEKLEIGWLVASRGSLIVADILVISFTWWKLLRSGPLGKVIPACRNLSLTDVFLRDGTIYFVLSLILNVLHMTFSLTSVFSEGQTSGWSNITTFTTPITTILVSRFFINMHEANLSSVEVDSNGSLHFSAHSDSSLPSFVAVPGTASAVGESSIADI